MSDLRQAAGHARNLSKQFQSFLEVAKALEEIGDLERVKKDLSTQVEQAVASKKQADDASKDAWAKADAAKDEMEGILANARQNAAEIVRFAEEEADVAKAAADKDVAAFKAAASVVRGTSDAQWQGHLDRMKKADVDYAAVHKKVMEIQADLAQLRMRIG